MSDEIIFERIDGKTGVRLKRYRNWFSLHITTNGWQWTGVNVDKTAMRMIADCFELTKNDFEQEEIT